MALRGSLRVGPHMARVDAVVIGLGVMGRAALRSLAARGVRALGIERFVPGHDRGSSHGATRIIRLSYFEHPSYVQLLREAYPLWRELEAKAGRKLLHITGIAEIGKPDSELVRGTLAAAREHALPHEVLNADELMHRYPAFRLPPEFIAVVQPGGGFVEAEPTVATLIALARSAGAEIRTNTTVRAIEPRGDRRARRRRRWLDRRRDGRGRGRRMDQPTSPRPACTASRDAPGACLVRTAAAGRV